MTATNNHPLQETKEIAESLLFARFGGPVQLDWGTKLTDHSHVFRFTTLDAPVGIPNSVIVKRSRLWNTQTHKQDTSEPFPGARRLFNDWAGIQFLSQVAGDDALAPQFYAGHRTTGLFIMEDLGTTNSPEELLLKDDSQFAKQLLIDMVRTLGNMHANTIGKQEEFNRIRNALGLNPTSDNYHRLSTRFYAALERLGLTPSPGLEDELETVITALENPGPFLAYTHGDPCLGNALRVGLRLKWFDFEAGNYRHALIDGVYGRIHFPSCWCVNRLPEPIWRQMERAYRTALAQGCPEATDDTLYYQAVVEACIHWGLALFGDHPRLRFFELLKDDETWGISTGRQRVLLRSDIIAWTTQEFGYLEAIGVTFADLATKLRALWPPEADAMPIYPAFQGG